MSESNYVILCSVVLPKSLKTIEQASIDLYDDEYMNMKEMEQSIRRKNYPYKDILEKLDLTEEEKQIEELLINITIVSRNLHNHHQFSM